MTTRIIGFDKIHHEAVASGAKRRTIRRHRGNGSDPKPGDTLRLWAGLRTRNARLLGQAECLAVRPCLIETAPPEAILSAAVDGDPVMDLEAFSRLDGFDAPEDMARFWIRIHGPGSWSGILIEW